jgi:hypothetical protein
MEFDTESDPETLYELFGEDADALAESVSSCVLTLKNQRSDTFFVSCQIEVLSGFTFWNGVVL